MESLIEVRGLVKKYKDLTAVDGLDLDVKKRPYFRSIGTKWVGKIDNN